MIAERHVRIGFDLADQADEVSTLLKRYGTRMDLADACLVRMSELTKKSQVFTLDRRDFSVYRRNGREAIPLIAPPIR
jgi:predicted nucleic acid-binding protein